MSVIKVRTLTSIYFLLYSLPATASNRSSLLITILPTIYLIQGQTYISNSHYQESYYLCKQYLSLLLYQFKSQHQISQSVMITSITQTIVSPIVFNTLFLSYQPTLTPQLHLCFLNSYSDLLTYTFVNCYLYLSFEGEYSFLVKVYEMSL
jgi:hypothetical protein